MSSYLKNIAAFTFLLIMALFAGRLSGNAPDKKLPWVTGQATATQVEQRTFDSSIVGSKISYHTFLPEGYESSSKRLPVLYWLHGTEGGILGIPPLAKHFSNEMRSGKMPLIIVVFANGLPARLWSDSKNGAAPVESVFINELIPDVDRKFHTIANKKGRILEGFSMGGYGAARMGLKYPEIFAGISILAGGPFDLELQGARAKQHDQLREFILREICSYDLDYFKELSPISIVKNNSAPINNAKLIIRHVVGEKDNSRDLNRNFHQLLSSHDINHEYLELSNVEHSAIEILEALAKNNNSFYWAALNSN